MALSDNMRLFDISTRLALYLEDVKVNEARQFNALIREVSESLEDLFKRVNYKTLDGLSKYKLNRLIIQLRESQFEIYSKYTNVLIKSLREFMQVNLQVNRRIWVASKIELDDEPLEDESKIISDKDAIEFLQTNSDSNSLALFGLAAITGSDDRLWSQITNSPIPANGLYLLPFIKTFANSAQSSVENTIRKAWANGWTVQETLDAIIGNGSIEQGTPSQLHKLNNQATSVVHTAMAFVSMMTLGAVSSSIFGKYIWNSVIDSRTSNICISRSRKIYTFGQGPLPPAHIRCRSHITPINKASDFSEQSFYSWLSRQPSEFQDDILGESKGDLLRSGELKAEDLQKYESTGPLSYEAFAKKIKLILSR